VQLHGLSNPFSQHARGSKLPDTDSSKSVPVSLVNRYTRSSDANGNLAIRVKPDLANNIATATTITGNVITTFGTPASTVDYTALAAQFEKYRIVSWGVKIYSTLAPTDQSGFFTVMTNPTFGDGMDAASCFYEETRTFPVTETSVQWISKPVGNSYLDYALISVYEPWDECCIYASGLPASTSGCIQIEVYFNLECQVTLGAISSTIATPAADSKPHLLTAMGHVAKHLGGTKLANDAKSSILSILGRGLSAALKTGATYAGSLVGIPPMASYNLLKDW